MYRWFGINLLKQIIPAAAADQFTDLRSLIIHVSEYDGIGGTGLVEYFGGWQQ